MNPCSCVIPDRSMYLPLQLESSTLRCCTRVFTWNWGPGAVRVYNLSCYLNCYIMTITFTIEHSPVPRVPPTEIFPTAFLISVQSMPRASSRGGQVGSILLSHVLVWDVFFLCSSLYIFSWPRQCGRLKTLWATSEHAPYPTSPRAWPSPWSHFLLC